MTPLRQHTGARSLIFAQVRMSSVTALFRAEIVDDALSLRRRCHESRRRRAVERPRDAVGVAAEPGGGGVGDELVESSRQLEVVSEVGDRLAEVHRLQAVADTDAPAGRDLQEAREKTAELGWRGHC